MASLLQSFKRLTGLDKFVNLSRIIEHNGGILNSIKKLYYQDDIKIGTLVGTDQFGNKYFENPYYFVPRNRWVEFNEKVGLNYDASMIPPEWHRWITHMTEYPPTIEKPVNYSWMLPYQKNVTGTSGSYMPFNTVKTKIQPWNPNPSTEYKSAMVITNKMRYSQSKKYNNSPSSNSYTSYRSAPANHNSTDESDWQVDFTDTQPDYFILSKNDPYEQQAKYSPLIKLLTSYDPLVNNQDILTNTTTTNKIIGVTLGDGSLNTRQNINSTQAIDAIKLHNDMLKPAPRDGKFRVRMYYHQAIHDDTRLYGNGPWKYWGHGWGMELGYRPENKTKDFYQRGYTIERAYGRDFCKDQTKCRKSDPTFFENMLDAGKYSIEAKNHLAKE